MINVAALPSVEMREWVQLPKSAGVYFAIAENGEILYVGRTLNLYLRWKAHHRKPELQSIPKVRLAWIAAEESELDNLERLLIDQLKPRMNGTPVTGSKMAMVGALVPRPVARALKNYAQEEGRTVSQTLKRIIESDPNIKSRIRAA